MIDEDDRTALRRIGEIADATGLTVRTLRYYEEIGLLEPTARTDAGHRLYGPVEVERLYRICLLRQLGLPLAGVRAGLERDGVDVRSLMIDHLAAVEERLVAENRLRSRLVRLVETLSSNAVSSSAVSSSAVSSNAAPSNAVSSNAVPSSAVPSNGVSSTALPSNAVSSTEDTTGDLLSVLEDMTMLETTLDRRIAILVYEDIEAAFDYLIRVYGFGPGELTRDPDGNVVHGEIQAGDGEFWLHPESEEFGLRSPKNLSGATGTMAVMVDDVDAHHRHAVEQGATISYEPVDQDYGYREYSAVDAEGHLWSFMKPLD